MGCLADAEHADELVCAAIERALSGVGLCPDHQIHHLIVGGAASLEQFAQMPPVCTENLIRCAESQARQYW